MHRMLDRCDGIDKKEPTNFLISSLVGFGRIYIYKSVPTSEQIRILYKLWINA